MINDIDKILKDKLYNVDTDVSSSVWKNIEAVLDKKKKKRRLFYLWYLILFILLLSALFFVFNHQRNTDEYPIPDSQSHVVNVMSPNGPTDESEIGSVEVDFRDKFSDNNSILKNKFSKNQQYTSTTKSISKISTFKNSDNRASTEFSVKNENLYSFPAERRESKISEQVEGKYNYLIGANKLIIDGKYTNTELKKINSNKHKRLLNDCFPVDIKSWFVEAYAAPVYAGKSLTGSYTAYINDRKNTESSLLSYSMGARLGYLYKGYSIKSGFDYSNINEKFHIIIRNVKSTQTIITIDTIMNSDGTYTIRRDTTLKEQYGEEEIKRYNTYRTINLPIIAGYNVKYYKHSFGINAGVLFNLAFRRNGYILSEEGKIIEIKDDNNTIFEDKIGLSIYVSHLGSVKVL